MTPEQIYVAFGGCVALGFLGVAVVEAAQAIQKRLAQRAVPVVPWDQTSHDDLDGSELLAPQDEVFMPLPSQTVTHVANVISFPTPSLASPPPAEVSSSGANEAPMSDLSTIKNEFMSFLAKLDGLVPAAAQPAIQEAASTVHAAIATTEATLVSTAETAAPTVLSSVISKDVPAEFQPLASLALQLGIAALTAKAGL